MKDEVSYLSKPSALQQGIVLTIGILILIVAAYVGGNWLMGESATDNFVIMIEKIVS